MPGGKLPTDPKETDDIAINKSGLHKAVHSGHFDTVMLAVILLNCLTMGIEAENMLGYAMELEEFVKISEHVFTVIFCIELGSKTHVHGLLSLIPFVKGGSLWNFLDACLVISTGVVAVWILPLAGITGGSEFRLVSTLRAMRMFRLVRILRGSIQFKEVWLLLQGIIESSRTLVWTIAVIFFITYIFAVFGVVLIADQLKEDLEFDPGNQGLADSMTYVDGLGTFMFLLVQVLTLDSWTGVVRPMMEYISWVWVFFVVYISIAVLVLMNLVTAVIVENALAVSKKNEALQYNELQEAKKRAANRLHSLFTQIDSDGNGELTEEEFRACFHHKEIGPNMEVLGYQVEDSENIFHLLDQGPSNDAHPDEVPTINKDEFLKNFERIQGLAQARDMFTVVKQQDKMLDFLRSMQQQLTDLGSSSGQPFKQVGADSPLRSPSRAVEAPKVFSPSLQPASPPQGPGEGGQLSEAIDNLQDLKFKASISAQKLDQLCVEVLSLRRDIDNRLMKSVDEIASKAGLFKVGLLNSSPQTPHTFRSREVTTDAGVTSGFGQCAGAQTVPAGRSSSPDPKLGQRPESEVPSCFTIRG